MKKLVATIVCASLLFPVSVFADCCGNADVIAYMQTVDPQKLNAATLTNSNLSIINQTLIEGLTKIGASGAASSESIQKTLEAYSKMNTDALIVALNTALHQHRMAEKMQEYDEDLTAGKTPTQQLPGTNCPDQQSEGMSGIGVGGKTRSQSEKVAKKNLDRSGVYEKGVDQLDNLRYATEALKLQEKANLMPENSLTYTEEEYKANQVLFGAVLDPAAPLNLDKTKMNEDQKKEYQATLALRKIAMEPARLAAAQYMSALAPVYPLGNHVRSLFTSSNNGYSYPDSVAANGKVSFMEYMEAHNNWLNSPVYFENIRKQNIPGAQLETMNLMFQLQLEQLKTLRNISLVLATMSADGRKTIEEKLNKADLSKTN